ncbi:MAG: hypothetical protein V3U87_09935 [Methylococcaceae bacterium]
MRPGSNQLSRRRIQVQISMNVTNALSLEGVIAECSVQTFEGAKAADVAWASNDFKHIVSYKTPYLKAPEI